MADSQLFGILLIAMVAGVILFRLYTVLGRRTGNERKPQERLQRVGEAAPAASGQNVVVLPDRAPGAAEQQSNTADVVNPGLLDIRRVDRTFETEHFLYGARQAYQSIVADFAKRERAGLRPLLSDEVYSAFDAVMRGHEERNETVTYTLVGFKAVKLTHAELKARTAEITVEFDAEFVSVTTDPEGKVVDGDAKAVRDVHDVWTFARDTRSADPNWTLVATSGGG